MPDLEGGKPGNVIGGCHGSRRRAPFALTYCTWLQCTALYALAPHCTPTRADSDGLPPPRAACHRRSRCAALQGLAARSPQHATERERCVLRRMYARGPGDAAAAQDETQINARHVSVTMGHLAAARSPQAPWAFYDSTSTWEDTSWRTQAGTLPWPVCSDDSPGRWSAAAEMQCLPESCRDHDDPRKLRVCA